jgi:hypothetical protein
MTSCAVKAPYLGNGALAHHDSIVYRQDIANILLVF